eukprot:4220487-Pleurochrysis_carterae.AAC.1
MDTNKRSTKEETTWVRSGGINSAINRDQKKSCNNAGREEELAGANKQNQASMSERGRPKLKETKRGQSRRARRYRAPTRCLVVRGNVAPAVATVARLVEVPGYGDAAWAAIFSNT